MGLERESERLIMALREGKEAAFAHVFREYYGRLLNYAGRILRDTEMANDLVQEIFCRLYERRKELKTDMSLKSYLYKSVYNSCLDALKHRKVEATYISKELSDFYFSKVIQAPEVELKLLDEEIGNAVREAIQKLPERCREILVLSKIEGYSNKQIADQLNISVKTVEAQMTTAFSKLRKELEWLLCIIFFANI